MAPKFCMGRCWELSIRLAIDFRVASAILCLSMDWDLTCIKVSALCLVWCSSERPLTYLGDTSWYYYHTSVQLSIAVTLHVRQDHEDCLGPIPVTWGFCQNSLHSMLDACNTGTLDGKQGGYIKKYVSSCLGDISSSNRQRLLMVAALAVSTVETLLSIES